MRLEGELDQVVVQKHDGNQDVEVPLPSTGKWLQHATERVTYVLIVCLQYSCSLTISLHCSFVQ